MEKMKTTKKIMTCGNSLVVNITKEAAALGLNRGDYVEVAISKPPKDQD